MLIENWRRILFKAWSVRLALLAALLSGVEIVLPQFSDAIPRGVFAALMLVLTLAATIARLVAQPRSLPDEKQK